MSAQIALLIIIAMNVILAVVALAVGFRLGCHTAVGAIYRGAQKRLAADELTELDRLVEKSLTKRGDE